MADARRAHRNSDKPLDEIDCYLTGIRGNSYHAAAYSREVARGEVWLELVPEPNNPSDPFALAVDLDEARIGYVGATMAYQYQWMVRAANAAGARCMTPGFIENEHSTWLVLPTLQVASTKLPVDASMARLREIWEAMPSWFREQVERDQFHLTGATASALWHHRSLAPELFPTVPDEGAFSIAWGRTLNAARYARNERVEAERRQRREDKERQRRAREDARTSHQQSVLKLHESGMAISAISKELGAHRSTVIRILDRHGIAREPTGGANTHSRSSHEHRIASCFHALELQRSGLSRAAIAERMTVAVDTVKLLLRDGRFYEHPERFPGRLLYARRAYLERWSRAEHAGAGARRAIADARTLLELGRLDLLEAADFTPRS